MAASKLRYLLLASLLLVAGCDALSRGLAPLLADARKPVPGDSKEFVVPNPPYEVGKLKYERSDFASLDELLGKAQTESQRTPSGLWRYGVVLSGVKDEIGDGESAADFPAAEAKARLLLASPPASPYAPPRLA